VDTKEYVDMYPIISKHLTNRKVYAIGYKLVLEVNGQERAIDHNLHIHLPNVSKLTDVYYIVGERSGALDYTMEDGRILISMSQLNQDITTVILLQQRALLKPWQIILIVVLVVLVILAIVITIVIVRKKKKERYSIHDKI